MKHTNVVVMFVTSLAAVFQLSAANAAVDTRAFFDSAPPGIVRSVHRVFYENGDPYSNVEADWTLELSAVLNILVIDLDEGFLAGTNPEIIYFEVSGNQTRVNCQIYVAVTDPVYVNPTGSNETTKITGYLSTYNPGCFPCI